MDCMYVNTHEEEGPVEEHGVPSANFGEGVIGQGDGEQANSECHMEHLVLYMH